MVKKLEYSSPENKAMNVKWQALMVHLPAEDHQDIYDSLTDGHYDIGEVLVAHEPEPYSHYHIAFEGSPDVYHNWSKHIFSDRQKKLGRKPLRGQIKNGLCREYGKITVIKDLEQLLTYSVKDKNVKTNIESERLTKFLEASFKKADSLSLLKEIMSMIEKKDIKTRKTNKEGQKYYCIRSLRLEIIKVYRKKEITMTRCKIQNQINFITQFSKDFNLRMSDEELDCYLFYEQ